MAGIDKTLQVFDDLGELAVSAVSIGKKGLSFSAFGDLLKVLAAGKELIIDAPVARVEFAQLSAQDSAKIGEAAYVLVKKIMDAVNAKV